MSVFRYPSRTLVGDYARAGVGLGVGLGVLAVVPPSPVIVVVFGGLSVVFAAFALRTVQRQLLRVRVTGEEIASTGFSTRILPWRALERVKLRYYGTRRQARPGGGGGFLQLTLSGGGTTMRLESSIEGFEAIARRSALAARQNGVQLDAASAGNLLELGIETELPPAAEAVSAGH